MNILYAVSEAYPFAKNGGLGDVAGSYPVAMAQKNVDIRVILPLYDTIPEEYRSRMELVSNFTVQLALEMAYCGLYQLSCNGVVWYFVENEYYFHRGRLYGCEDDDARFAFFSKAVCASLRYLDWRPEVIHCNDWQTALIPLYLEDYRLQNPAWRPIRTMFTIHNVEYQGNFSYHTLTDVFGLSGVLFADGIVELDGSVNLMKGAIELADCLTTVSPTYAKELSGPDAAGPMAEVIASHTIHGIRNGIAEDANPFDSRLVHRPYDRDSVEEKVFNKLWMQEMHGLRVDQAAPVFGCVSRLLPRKGLRLLVEVLPEFLKQGCQLVLTGDGKREIIAQLWTIQEQFPGQVDLTSYSEERAAEIFSSADLFLMPSYEEPCGTAQMQAMRYGTPPVVRATGGLKDTVLPYDKDHPEGYGFVFEDYTAEALRDAISRALAVYKDRETYESLQKRCMDQDFSWNMPTESYLRLYESLMGQHKG